MRRCHIVSACAAFVQSRFSLDTDPPSLIDVPVLVPGSEEVVPVPSMGDSITEGTIVEWAKQPGDSVEVDEVVVVLETDKVRCCKV